MLKWYCSSSLCFNNYTSRDKNGDTLKFYCLPNDKNIQSEYQKFFKTAGIKWRNGHIFYAHWTCGERKTPDTLPDVAVPPDQYKLLKVKYSRAKKSFDAAKTPTRKQILAYKNSKRKLDTPSRICCNAPVKINIRKSINKHTTPRMKRSTYKKNT